MKFNPEDLKKAMTYSRNPALAMRDAKTIIEELETHVKRDSSTLDVLNSRNLEIVCLGVCVAEVIKDTMDKKISAEDGAVGLTNLYGALVLLGYTDGLNKGRSESILKAIEGGEFSGSN